MSKHRARRKRRTAKQALHFGAKAKRKHARRGGRSGSIRAKQLASGSIRL